ncbi:DUF456 domain-containing protein [Carbonactinospora thermoautotrophica]|uniref:Membrane protein n=1 Tax=Carbonactinospora thermoautotrophica TaxID=1469144 RepID=A0A132MV73_9ACTN|nr:DUF456 domain-containing protein [Carbonactinospora thermoautotrophica]KWX01272.1 hypothetical protein LI90_2300 [Carbonactinospora thermoautotrophica]KWX05751.1 membrane protein [Carbonactinospora thermoautotrophica]KWX09491.1 membrane protein [Carbonactinospora thermoautotrophica]MCX9192156.1 DUF456 domain-containing protein [Carbonactinospora thermoautotrophica]
MDTTGLVLVGLTLLVGLAGVVLPVLPGLLLCWAAVLVWALVERTAVAWAVLGVATLLIGLSQVAKYLVPGRRMRAAGVPWSSLALGGALGVVGFFLVPVAGLVLGFVLGVYAAEWLRLRTREGAWRSTVHALKAVGLSILIELAAGLLVTATWLGAVLLG